MSRAQQSAMTALAALCLWGMAFLFGLVTERMRAGCERYAAAHQAARDMEERR